MSDVTHFADDATLARLARLETVATATAAHLAALDAWRDPYAEGDTYAAVKVSEAEVRAALARLRALDVPGGEA